MTLTGALPMRTLTLKSGDRVNLAADEPFDLLSVSRGVTDAVVKGGVFGRVQVVEANGFKLSGFKLRTGPLKTAADMAMQIVKSSNVIIEGGDCEGWIATTGVPETATTLDPTGLVIGRPAGVMIQAQQGGDGFVVEDVKGRNFRSGYLVNGQTRIVCRAVHLAGLRTLGFGGIPGDGALIEKVSATDYQPWNYGGKGDHGDFIHFWSRPNGATIVGLTIRDAVFCQSVGYPLMGIFLEDNGPGTGFSGTLLERCVVSSAHGQGFLLENVRGELRDCMAMWSRSGLRGADPRDTPIYHIVGGSKLRMTNCVGGVTTRTSGEVVK